MNKLKKECIRDGGGTITTVELGQVMTTFGWSPTEGELQDLIGVIDQDDNGCISFDEFVWLMQQVEGWRMRVSRVSHSFVTLVKRVRSGYYGPESTLHTESDLT